MLIVQYLNISATKSKNLKCWEKHLIYFKMEKQKKDNNEMFNRDYFVKWIEILLQTLKDKNISNTIIVMDNAKYHKYYQLMFLDKVTRR